MGDTLLSNYYEYLTCPRCLHQIAVDDNIFRCTSAACIYSAEPFPTVAELPLYSTFRTASYLPNSLSPPPAPLQSPVGLPIHISANDLIPSSIRQTIRRNTAYPICSTC